MLDTNLSRTGSRKTCQVLISDGPVFQASFPASTPDRECVETTLRRFSFRFVDLIEARVDVVDLDAGWVPSEAHSDGSLETSRGLLTPEFRGR